VNFWMFIENDNEKPAIKFTSTPFFTRSWVYFRGGLL
jgi:hypothetical protein